MEYKPFPCTQCGVCCRKIGAIKEKLAGSMNPVIEEAIRSFPYKYDSNGVCEKLVDNKCSVYEDRPLLCSVEGMGIMLGMNRDEWFRHNANECNKLIRAEGLDDSFLIKDYDLL